MAKKSDKMGIGQFYEAPANRFYVDERDMSSPYLMSYYAARSTGPLIVNKPKSDPFAARQAARDSSEVKKAKKAKQSAAGQQKVKRNFFVVLTLLLVVVLIAFLAISYVGIDAIVDYTSIAVKKTTIGEGEEAETTVENIGLDDIVMGTVQRFTKKPVEAEAAEEGETGAEEEAAEEKVYVYYSDRMENVASLDTVGKMSAYGLPVGLAVFAVVAIIFLIRLIISVFTPKRRKFFVLSGIVLLVLGVVINLFLYMWSAGTDFSKISEFIYLFAKDSELAIQAGVGALVLIGLPLLITITSIFCFRSKKKFGK